VRAATGAEAGRIVFWPGWVAAAALLVCGVAHFPLRREGVPGLVYGVSLAASGLCGLLALALALRAGVAALVAGSVVPTVLAGLGSVEGSCAPSELSQASAITVAPPPNAGLTAACAALASLAALRLLLVVRVAERHPAAPPADCDNGTGTGRPADEPAAGRFCAECLVGSADGISPRSGRPRGRPAARQCRPGEWDPSPEPSRPAVCRCAATGPCP
jgi:hypothetical protein